jgi:nucleoid-associated protein YgaU
MRTDVKLTVAVGGVLLAVLVVYVLVASKPDSQMTAILAQGEEGKESPQPGPGPGASEGRTLTANRTEDASVPSAATGKTDPFAAQSGEAYVAAQDARWNKVLSTGRLERQDLVPLLTEAPTADSGPTTRSMESAPEATVPGAFGEAQSPAVVYTPPTTQPVKGDRTHRVQSGETLSSIAQATYGNRNLWPYIRRANPNVEPTKLRPGMVIVLPDPEAVKARTQPAPATINYDAATEYRVQDGDTLEHISRKLYGDPNHVDQLYEQNKQTIGPDRHRIKIGMLLKLAEAPKTGSGR